jgi:hypothetical protein
VLSHKRTNMSFDSRLRKSSKIIFTGSEFKRFHASFEVNPVTAVRFPIWVPVQYVVNKLCYFLFIDLTSCFVEMKVGYWFPSVHETMFSFVEYKEIRLPVFITASCVK